nr:unnamed protein product [Callosobruchus analis]
MEGVQEYIIVDTQPAPLIVSEISWSRETTLLLVDLYRPLRNKKLWEIIAEEANATVRCNFTSSQVENRCRVLERNYKRMVDNNNKTGRGCRSFTNEKEVKEMFGKKRNVQSYWIRQPSIRPSLPKRKRPT